MALLSRFTFSRPEVPREADHLPLWSVVCLGRTFYFPEDCHSVQLELHAPAQWVLGARFDSGAVRVLTIDVKADEVVL